MLGLEGFKKDDFPSFSVVSRARNQSILSTNVLFALRHTEIVQALPEW